MSTMTHRLGVRYGSGQRLMLCAGLAGLICLLIIAAAAAQHGNDQPTTTIANEQAVAEEPATLQPVQTRMVRVIDESTVALEPVNGQLSSTDEAMSETTVRLLDDPDRECLAETSALRPGDPVTLRFDLETGTHDSRGRAQGCLQLGETSVS